VARAFRLEIHTPFRRFHSGKAVGVTLTVSDGELGVLADRAPFCAPLETCIVTVRGEDGSVRRAAVTAGLVECSNGTLTLLAGAAEWPEEVDRARAETALARAEGRMRTGDSDAETRRSLAAAARARNRIAILGGSEKP